MIFELLLEYPNNYEFGGQRFESFRARHFLLTLTMIQNRCRTTVSEIMAYVPARYPRTISEL